MAFAMTTKTAIQTAREALRNAPDKVKTVTVADAMRELRADLLKARAAGYSYEDLRSLLEQSGIKASAAAVQRGMRTKRPAGPKSMPSPTKKQEGEAGGGEGTSPSRVD